jgi:hypothetical protein
MWFVWFIIHLDHCQRWTSVSISPLTCQAATLITFPRQSTSQHSYTIPYRRPDTTALPAFLCSASYNCLYITLSPLVTHLSSFAISNLQTYQPLTSHVLDTFIVQATTRSSHINTYRQPSRCSSRTSSQPSWLWSAPSPPRA